MLREMNPEGIVSLRDLVRYVERHDWASFRSGHLQVQKAKLFAQYVSDQRSFKSDQRSLTEGLTTPVIESFLVWLEETRNSKPATVNAYIAAISKIARYAHDLGLIKTKPRIKRRRGAAVRTDFFTRSQEKQLCDVVSRLGYHHYAHLYVWLAETGVRVGEAQRLVWQDIDVSRKVLAIPAHITKTDRPRILGLSDRAISAVSTQSRNAPGPWHWFDRYEAHLVWRKLRAELDWMHSGHVMHTFRHTCASRLVQSGASLYQVQRWLGHSTITQTEKYAKFSPNNMRNMAGLLDNFEDA